MGVEAHCIFATVRSGLLVCNLSLPSPDVFVLVCGVLYSHIHALSICFCSCFFVLLVARVPPRGISHVRNARLTAADGNDVLFVVVPRERESGRHKMLHDICRSGKFISHFHVGCRILVVGKSSMEFHVFLPHFF